NAAKSMKKAAEQIGFDKVRMLFVETPGNPTNTLVDLRSIVALADEISDRTGRRVLTMVDNTLLGPVFQTPADFGVDLVMYSATKFIGGHSDAIAGVVSGP